MAVSLLGTNSARIDYGDIAAIAGVTGLSVAFTIKLSASPASNTRFVSQWGNGNAFLIQGRNTTEIGFLVGDDGSALYGPNTTALNLTNGSQYRVVCKIGGLGGTKTQAIWVNGASASITAWLSGSPTSLANANSAVQVGFETAESSAPQDGDYSEFAIWGEEVPDWVAAAYGLGYSPFAIGYKSNLILYSRLTNLSDLKDLWRGTTGTNTGGTAAAHPGVIYSKRRQIVSVAAGGGGGGTFKAFMAVQNNSVVGVGVH